MKSALPNTAEQFPVCPGSIMYTFSNKSRNLPICAGIHTHANTLTHRENTTDKNLVKQKS